MPTTPSAPPATEKDHDLYPLVCLQVPADVVRLQGRPAAQAPAQVMTALLTDAERAAVRKAGDLWGDLCKIVADGPTRDHDLAELVVHIHAIQHAVMAQAAARAYPAEFRLLGSSILDGD